MTEATAKTVSGKRYFLPLLAFLALAILFALGFHFGKKTLKSARIGQQAPIFSLAPLQGGHIVSDALLREGHVSVVNIFASWCSECRQEHDVLNQLTKDPAFRAKGGKLIGIDYKDNKETAVRYLGQNGNPYDLIGDDAEGRAAIEWGSYGVPETFIVRGDGVIVYQHIGPMTDDLLRAKILPEIQKAAEK